MELVPIITQSLTYVLLLLVLVVLISYIASKIKKNEHINDSHDLITRRNGEEESWKYPQYRSYSSGMYNRGARYDGNLSENYSSKVLKTIKVVRKIKSGKELKQQSFQNNSKFKQRSNNKPRYVILNDLIPKTQTDIQGNIQLKSSPYHFYSRGSFS